MDFKGSDDDQTARFEGMTGIFDQKAAIMIQTEINFHFIMELWNGINDRGSKIGIIRKLTQENRLL